MEEAAFSPEISTVSDTTTHGNIIYRAQGIAKNNLP
jgi:hypothetical protein